VRRSIAPPQLREKFEKLVDIDEFLGKRFDMILVLIYENDGFHEKHAALEQMLNSDYFVIHNMPVLDECRFTKICHSLGY